MKHDLDIDRIKKYDAVVCGGGFTGVAAAVSAAGSGMKTLLIERNGCLGGVGTAGAVTCLLGGMDYDEGDYLFVTGGLFKRLYYSLRKTGDCVDVYSINRDRNPHAWHRGLAQSIIFDNEAMKRLLDGIVTGTGVDVIYNSYIFDAASGKNKMEYILAAGKGGVTAVYGDAFIDCTGDADIAFMAGCPYEKGRPEDNLMTPATLIMNIENVDTEKLLDYIEKNNSPRFREEIKGLLKKDSWPFEFEIFISMLINRTGRHMINSIRQVGVDGTDEESITMGFIDGRIQNKRLFDIIQKNFPGYGDAVMASTAEMLGIRETRRIKGDYILGLDDLLMGKGFDDTIALSSYGFDLPDPQKPSYQPLEGKSIGGRYTMIPYRCLVPQNIDNLVVAGRSISVERDVLGPVRVMGPCIGTGHAAGTAALQIADGKKNKSIDLSKLKDSLREQECILGENEICKVRRT
ncbi:MAG: FAD-dependent oxidoreductase [Clostridia bacterium]|nr:FAD-dependent oxidoreductase [Clostridia bacterium]